MIAQVAERKIFVSRSNVSDVERLFGKKWSVLGGDKRSLGLHEIDLSQVALKRSVRPSERLVHGRERRARLMISGDILLRIETFALLWNDKVLIPEAWENEGRIFFDGSPLCGPPGKTEYIPYIEFSGRIWSYGTQWIENYWSSRDVSAVLPWNYKRLQEKK